MKPTTTEYDKIWATHCARVESQRCDYNPERGLGCPDEHLRREVTDPGGHKVRIPGAMIADPLYSAGLSVNDFEMLRCRHDFYFWAWRCVTIKDKISGADQPFVLNAPQRLVAAKLEEQRRAGQPMRLIILKARQWGGSTLVQLYMAWIQSCVRRNWHSLICAHVKDAAATIRGIYSKMLGHYPRELWDGEGDAAPRFVPFERTNNVRELLGRGCRVTLTSAENQDAARGSDYAMAHLSEVAFWPATLRKDPTDLIRTICGAVARAPYTLIVMESTANGVGNFFHQEWLRAVEGKSDKLPVFVAWHDIEIYREPVTRKELPQLWRSLDEYELKLWNSIPTMTLDRIKWYHNKRREYNTHAQMQAEYPTDAQEAFTNSGCNVFDVAHVEAMRADCRDDFEKGEVSDFGKFEEVNNGKLKKWVDPQAGHRYVAAVDVGGRSESSDWSVIAVIDFSTPLPEVVAQWRGHIDHDLLCERASRIGRWYNDALLVVESNTLETKNGGESLYLLTRLRDTYPNLYLRESFDSVSGQRSQRVGFHTSASTKPLVIDHLIGLVRDHGYIERDVTTVDELLTYERLPNGSYAARHGKHDDCLMTRAIGLYVALDQVRLDCSVGFVPPPMPLMF